MKKVINGILNTLIIIMGLLLLTPNILLNFGINSFVVLSGSMEPLIETGSMVMINSRDTDVEIGDIVLYRLNQTNVVHRIIEETEDGKYITKGDNNENADFAPVSEVQIYGKAIEMPWGWCIPKAGYISNWVQTNRLYLIIGIIAMILFRILTIILNDEK